MNIEQLEYFVSVANTENYRVSSEGFHKSKQVIWKAISDLEKELGVPLFLKIGKKIRLTQEGSLLKNQAEKILAEVEEFRAQVKLCFNGVPELPRSVKIAIALSHYGGAIVPKKCIQDLKKENGKIRFSVMYLSEGACIDAVKTGLVDVAVVLGPLNEANLMNEILFSAKGAVVLSVKHPLAGKELLSLEEVLHYPLVRPSSLRGLYSRLKNYARRENLNLTFVEPPLLAKDANEFFLAQTQALAIIVLNPDLQERFSQEITVIPLVENEEITQKISLLHSSILDSHVLQILKDALIDFNNASA